MNIEVKITGDLAATVQNEERGLCGEFQECFEADPPEALTALGALVDILRDEQGDEESDVEEEGRCDNAELGRMGEDAAARYLEHLGFEILERNWHCPYGEADIIALEDDCIVFVEVKTRRSIRAGIPEEAVTRRKRARYERIALCYLSEVYGEAEAPVRFDVIGICVAENNKAMLRHHRNCFDGWA